LNAAGGPSPSVEVAHLSSIVAILLSLVAVGLLVIATYVYRRQRKEKRKEEFNPPVTHIVNLSPMRYDDDDMSVGSFHDVYLGQMN
jgi:flagellar basal body-associated protein FliL